MPYISSRDTFHRYHRDNYISTIKTNNYGTVDVLGCYDCSWCFWYISVYSHELNEFIFSIIIRNVEEPSDRLLKSRIDRYIINRR